MSSQAGRGHLSSRRHGVGGHVGHNSPGYAQTVREMNAAREAGLAIRRSVRPPMFATVREALRKG